MAVKFFTMNKKSAIFVSSFVKKRVLFHIFDKIETSIAV